MISELLREKLLTITLATLDRGENIMFSWIKDRFTERTSLDGGMLIAVGVIGLFFSAIIPMNLICWAAIGYGVFTLVKSEG